MKISIIGAGQIGLTIAELLSKDSDIQNINLIDHNGFVLNEAKSSLDSKKIKFHKIELDYYEDISSIISKTDVVISALPSKLNWKISKLAVKNHVNYIDLGGSDQILERQFTLDEAAQQNNTWVIPNCGFSPGMVNIMAMKAFHDFDETDEITIYGGSIPANPKPPFYFQLAFSPLGLVKEYTDPSVIIKNGECIEVESLSDYEVVDLYDERCTQPLEAFTVAGRSTSLAKLLEKKVNSLKFKVLRYKGHKNLLDAFKQLGYLDNKIIDVRSHITFEGLFVRQLEKYMPKGDPDTVYAQVVTMGKKDNQERKTVLYFTKEHIKDAPYSTLTYCSAVSAIAVAKIISSESFERTGGVIAPEAIINYDDYKAVLSNYNFNIHYRTL